MRVAWWLMWTAVALAEVRLPAGTGLVRVQGEKILSVEWRAGRELVVLRTLEGREERAAMPVPADLRDRVWDVRDVGLLPGERIVATLVIELGEAVIYGIAREAGEGQFLLQNTGSFICGSVAPAGDDLWCYGRDMEQPGRKPPELRRFGKDEGRWPVQVPPVPLRNGGAPARIFTGGAAGVLWMPAVSVLCGLPETVAGAVACPGRLPREYTSMAIPSVTLDQRGRLYALLPDDTEESFGTRYRLWRWEKGWRVWDGPAPLPRGVTLVGSASRGLALYDRMRRSVEFIASP